MIKQKIKYLNLLFIFFIPVISYGQTMQSIFMQLPAECTPSINNKEKAVLLKVSKYIIPEGDSIEMQEYSIEEISGDYINYNIHFTTGQNGFTTFQIKKFKTLNGKILIVFTRHGGVVRSYFQQDLKIFYFENNRISEDRQQKLLPKEINPSDYLKKETPDSIKQKIELSVSTGYELYPENKIEFSIFPEMSLDDYEQWILGYSFSYTWTGIAFTKKLIIAEEDKE